MAQECFIHSKSRLGKRLHPNIGVHSAVKDKNIFSHRQKPLYTDAPGPSVAQSVTLQALRQRFMLVGRQGHFWLRLREETGTQLEFEPLHLVVMQVLLNQVALSLKSSLHACRDVGDHPRHEELHHEHDMLQRENNHTVKKKKKNFTLSIYSLSSKREAVVSPPWWWWRPFWQPGCARTAWCECTASGGPEGNGSHGIWIKQLPNVSNAPSVSTQDMIIIQQLILTLLSTQGQQNKLQRKHRHNKPIQLIYEYEWLLQLYNYDKKNPLK